MAHPLIKIEKNSVVTDTYFTFNSIVLVEALRQAGSRCCVSGVPGGWEVNRHHQSTFCRCTEAYAAVVLLRNRVDDGQAQAASTLHLPGIAKKSIKYALPQFNRNAVAGVLDT